MNIRKHIPNFLTCCNLLCGIAGILVVFTPGYDLVMASYFIYLACVFDFLDGFVARLLNVTSPIGKELDSLADMVTFGILPGFVMAALLGMNLFNGSELLVPGTSIPFFYLAFLIPVFSALRLAKFNIDTRQSDRFIGLPTPANALFISALPFLAGSDQVIARWMTSPFVLLVLVPLLSFLLVAELPLIALKFKNFGWAGNKMRYLLIISAILLLLILKFVAIPIIIILYIILSIIENTVNAKTDQ